MDKNRQISNPDLLIRKLYESAAESILIVRSDGSIFSANTSGQQLFGYSEDELRAMKVEDLIPKDYRKGHHSHRKAYEKNPSHRKMGEGRDLLGLRKDGKTIPIEISLNHLELEEGSFTIAFIVDISTRKETELALKKEKELSDTYFNQALSIFIALDMEKNILQVNSKGAEVLGWPEDKLHGKNWVTEFVDLQYRGDMNSVLEKLLSSSIPSLEFYVSDIITRSGKKRTIEWYTTLIRIDDKPHSILLSGVDITYRREIESSKTRAMMQGEEQERRRVAQELHDGLGQSLSAMNMHLGVLEKEKSKMTDKSKSSIENLKNLLENTIVEVKSISYDLMPKILESYGLNKALNYLCDIINEGGNIHINLQSYGIKQRLNPDIEVGLYRMAQELINNVIKHAAAKNINLQLIKHDQSLVLMIEDDGIGFETMRSKSDVKGLGLKNISTRVNSFNGSFYIDSLPGKGTTITIEIPV